MDKGSNIEFKEILNNVIEKSDVQQRIMKKILTQLNGRNEEINEEKNLINDKSKDK